MADRLQKVRTSFVKAVNKAVIEQLLDALLQCSVLNDGEVEQVKEENCQRADRARCLIDMVRKKGAAASEKFIAVLREQDPTLCAELGLASDATASACAAAAQGTSEGEKAISPVLIRSTEAFKREILQRHGNSIYEIKEKSGRKRLALLINNIKFDQPNMERRGAERDEENINKLLKDLDYEVVKHNNLSAQEIDEKVKAFSEREEHAQSDSTFVVIMSHGKRDAICGIHHKFEESADLFKIDRIFHHLNTKNCVGLRSKPKVIIIQACRGDETGSTWVCDNVPDPVKDMEEDTIREDHKEKDFISLMSCTPDTKSYRHVVRGTVLIQRIVEIFNTYAHEDHIEELFRKVMSRFEDFPKQMPSKDRATLTKNFYLFPGL
ncbi:caspase a [Scleropages formosus]|uniref:Caspase b, like n=1 Tax=Scleropages formosus TaxID=113540 RepID=A0A8C9R361_SCLFO|nr:caspase-1-A-like [Scleropages formosus]XP_018588105.1 caspase-1-A-like [Scleropages formosus]